MLEGKIYTVFSIIDKPISIIVSYLHSLSFSCCLSQHLISFFFFFFEVNDLLHGARWQSVVATL